MLCTQRRKGANSEQSPLGHWELTSSARRTANPGASAFLRAGQESQNKGSRWGHTKSPTNQGQCWLSWYLVIYLRNGSHTSAQNFLHALNPKSCLLYYSAHGIKQLLFTWLKLFLIDSMKIKTGLGYSSKKEHYLPSIQKALGSITSKRKQK